MHILYHHRTRGEHVEGVHIRGLVDGLQKLGCSVTVLSPRGVESREAPHAAVPSDNNAEKSWTLLRWVARRCPEPLFELGELAYNLIAYVRLNRLCSEQQPRILYERYALFMFAGILIARRHRLPIVLEMNDSAVVERVRPLFFKRIAARLERAILKRATGLVFVSSKFQQVCESAYGALPPSAVSPNCADPEIFDPSRFRKQEIRDRLGLASNAIVVGYVGHFVAWHGVHWFVEEILPRIDENPRMVLLMVGDGGVFEQVRAAVERAGKASKILLTGRVPHEKVPEMMAAMDVAVLPDSNVFGSPMKLFEFMAMGVPVIAPDLPPIAEVVRSAETGWLFPAKDRRACVETLLSVVKGAASVSEVGRNARSDVLAHRQWVHNASAILRLAEAKREPT